MVSKSLSKLNKNCINGPTYPDNTFAFTQAASCELYAAWYQSEREATRFPLLRTVNSPKGSLSDAGRPPYFRNLALLYSSSNYINVQTRFQSGIQGF